MVVRSRESLRMGMTSLAADNLVRCGVREDRAVRVSRHKLHKPYGAEESAREKVGWDLKEWEACVLKPRGEPLPQTCRFSLDSHLRCVWIKRCFSQPHKLIPFKDFLKFGYRNWVNLNKWNSHIYCVLVSIRDARVSAWVTEFRS